MQVRVVMRQHWTSGVGRDVMTHLPGPGHPRCVSLRSEYKGLNTGPLVTYHFNGKVVGLGLELNGFELFDFVWQGERARLECELTMRDIDIPMIFQYSQRRATGKSPWLCTVL